MDPMVSAEEFWLETLRGTEAAVFPEPPVNYQPVAGALSRHETADLRWPGIHGLQWVASNDPATIVQVAWALLIAQYTNSTDIVIGRATENGVVPMRIQLDWHSNIAEATKTVRQHSRQTVAHAGYHLAKLRALSLDANRACGFQFVLSIRDQETPGPGPGLETHDNYALSAFCDIRPASLSMQLRYDPNVLDEGKVRLLAWQMDHLVRQLVRADAATTLRDIDLLSDNDRRQIRSYNARVPARVDKTVHQALGERAAEHPDAVAVDAWDGEMSYRELIDASEALASWFLAKVVVAPGRRVPVCIEKSLWTTVIILAIARHGGVFVVLDPLMPVGHLSRIVKDLGATRLVCTPGTLEVARNVGVPLCVLDKLHMQILAQSRQRGVNHDGTNGTEGTEGEVSADSPLYAVYTSGSTGAPKGALISHANLCSAARHQAPRLGFDRAARSFDYSSYSFDAYVFNTFYTLLTGGCLCVPSDEDRLRDLQGSINRAKANLVQLTPSVARLLNPEAVPEVRTLILTGEKIQTADLVPWAGRVRVINAYGPSECAIMCAANLDLAGSETALNIGTGLGCVLWLQDVVNPSRLAPVGAVGEIVIEGPIVGIGYLNNPEMTERTQVKNPPWLLQGPRNHGTVGRKGVVYRTGDHARYAADGSLVYLGRADSQTKLHGQRIETAAVESRIRDILPPGYECAAGVVSTSIHSQLLVGFLRSPKALSEDLSDSHKLVATIKDFLASRVPPFMIPSLFWPLPQLPMTATGKIDRRRLRLMAAETPLEVWVDGGGGSKGPASAREGAAQAEDPANPLELALRRLWVRALGDGGTAIRPQDSFFRRGGDSIAAVKLVTAAAREGYHLDVPTVLRNPRLSDMAKYMVRDRSALATGLPSSEDRSSSASLLPSASPELLKQLASACHVPPDGVEDIYPCSAIQQAMLAVTAQRPGSFVMQKVIALPPTVDATRMREAWRSVVAANTILRTRVVDTATDGLLQVVLRHSKGAEAGLKTVPRVQDLHLMDRGAPLVYVNFITPSQNGSGDGVSSTTMVLTMHHAVYDAWSMDIYLQQLLRAYEGKRLIPSTPYRDFITHVASIDHQAAQEFWGRRLETTEAPQFPALPERDFQPLARSLVQHSASNIAWPSRDGITASTVARAACAVLLAAYTNSNDVVFGATVLGRQSGLSGIDRLAGPTIATVPVRAELDLDAPALDLLVSMQAQALDAIPFEQHGISQIRRANRGAEQACRFQTLLVVQPHPNTDGEGEGQGPFDDAFRYRMEDEDVGAFSTHALTVICFLEPAGLRLCLSFDDRLLAAPEARRMAGQIEHAVRQLCTAELERTRLRDVGTAGADDVRQLWTWNAAVPETVSSCVHDLIAATAAAKPDALAVEAWDGRFTYAELLHTATRLASYLQTLGVGPEVMVPTCFEKSVWAAVSMLAVILAGGVGVAVDVSQPEERLRAIISQTGACIVLASARTADLAGRIAPDVVVVTAAAFQGPGAVVPEQGLLSPDRAPTGDNALFIVFTSGSTGTPKGAVITHAGFSSAIRHQREAFGMTTATRVLDFASYAFDVAWFDLLHTLAVGASLCIPSDQARRDNLVATIRQFDANYLFLTPSLGRHLDSECAPTIKDLIMGGEAVGRGDMAGWADDVRVRVAYGPAECTVMSNIATFPANQLPRVVHTGPGRGVNCWIVSSANPDLLAPLGAVGELVLEGPLLGRGYLREPEKTAAAFADNPPWLLSGGGPSFPGRPGRIYRTGDLARFTGDGAIVIVGRKDAQVKIRGQRVELEEVETHARLLLPESLSSATLAAEVVVPKGQTSKALVLFIECAEPIDTAVSERILSSLAEVLPVYMVPFSVVALPSIPTTATSKVSRKALRELASTMTLFTGAGTENGKGRGRPPATVVEKQLHGLWAGMLGLDPSTIGMEDNFLHLGGDSVSAMRLAGHAHEQGLPLTVPMILRKPRLVDMSRAVSTALESRDRRPPKGNADSAKGLNSTETGAGTGSGTRAISIREAAQKLGCSEQVIVAVLPVTEFQQHSVECAALRPRAEWGFFSVSTVGLDPARLYQACVELYGAVEIFRTVFVPVGVGSAVRAVVLREVQPEITVEEVVDGSFDEATRSFCTHSLFRDSFPRQPLTTFAIFHRPLTKETRWVVSMSHAHYDGLSLPLVAEALAALYERRPLPRLLPFSRFVRKSSARTAGDYEHWRGVLNGSSMTAIPYHPAPGNGGSLARTKVYAQVPAIKARDGVTAATVVYAGWAYVLSSLTGSADVVFGRLVSGRGTAVAGFHNAVGACINHVPVRVTLDGAAEPSRVLAELQQQYIRGLAHEAVGLSEIVASCTDWPTGTVYGSTVHYQNIEEEPSFLLDGRRVSLRPVEDSGEADAPGCVRVAAYPAASHCTLELSMPAHFSLSDAQKIVQDLARNVEWLAGL